jgi:sugar lactone lactonase YvrE
LNATTGLLSKYESISELTTGIITTVAGSIPVEDGGLATSFRLISPNMITLDSSGNLYIADTGNYRIRKVDSSGIITTIAGNGPSGLGGYSGDGGLATNAQFGLIYGITLDSFGNLYIGDY